MSVEEDNPDVMGPLKALIEEARSQKKWLWCCYQDLWFSPDELTARNKEGKFRWDVVNWQLRDPQEMLDESADRVKKAQDEVERIKCRIENRK